MILEIAQFEIVPGQEAAFEAVFPECIAILAEARGFRGCELRRGVEQPSRYRALIQWESIADHVEGFRGSPGHARFLALVKPMQAAPAQVDHWAAVASSA